MNATRFALPPIPQPPYRFASVPAAQRDLSGSTVQCITQRQAWQACMGEMLLVCKEAIRRRRRRRQQVQQQQSYQQPSAPPAQGEHQQEEEDDEQDDRKPAATAAAAAASTATTSTGGSSGTGTGCGSKPLSLEYIADRLDVDDPMWGYVIRHENNMLQGFITVTTFTNYQRTFRWDSCHACSFHEAMEDEEDAAADYGNGGGDSNNDTGSSKSKNNMDNDPYDMAHRKVDWDGSLAREMNATVRAGDIWNEGIVWPRIAEIGLLGGLGCGRTLVQLVLEQLECAVKPCARANYDYIVLQATDNSIPFYESLGFCRVGAVMQQENINNGDNNDNDNDFPDNSTSDSGEEEVVAEPLASDDSQPGGSNDPNTVTTALATTPGTRVVLSQTRQYSTKPGETPTQIAKKLSVNVHDIIFLNQHVYPELVPSSKTRVGTTLLIPNETVVAVEPPAPPRQEQVPQQPLGDDAPQQQPQPPVWYIAKENETPRSIARKLGLDCLQLVNANKVRLPGLLSSSRLRDGTRVRVANFDAATTTDLYKPYAHWTFPDDQFEEGEPSYMMALKLKNRRNHTSNNKNNKERPFAASLAVPVVDYEPNNGNTVNDAAAAALVSSTTANDPTLESKAVVAAAPPRAGRASRRRWQSHQDVESHGDISSSSSSSTQASHSTTTISTATINSNNDDDDNDDAISEKAPKPPMKPAFVHPYRLFVADFKRDHADLLYKKHVGEISRITGDSWRQLSPREKQRYDQRIAAMKHDYESALQSYRDALASRRRAQEQRRLKKLGLVVPASAIATASSLAAAASAPQPPLSFEQSSSSSSINLFNKVVKIKPECSHITEGSLHLYEYWYVLTFIPDLQWCHLAPLYQVGRVFGDDKPNSKGRPIWKLVDEELGEEVDISSSLVIPVKAKSMKRTLDADKEEWDVIGTPLSLTAAPAYSRSNSLSSGFHSSQMQAVSRRGSLGDSTCDGSSVAATSTTVGTSTSRKRKRNSFASDMTSPSSKQQPSFAMAVMPRTGKRVKVWIKIGPGQRGRPRGSKNKRPKAVPNHVVTTGQKKAPPSYSYNDDDDDNNSSNNSKNESDDKKDKNSSKNGRASHRPSKRNNSRVKVAVPPTDVMSFLEHASSPVKQQKKSKRSPVKSKAVAATPSSTHPAAVPASRKSRNGKESLAAVKTVAASDRAEHVEESKAVSVPPEKFSLDSVVIVQARTWPGCNKPGGVARVTRVQETGDSVLYDVKYVLGGREKDIDGVFLSGHDDKSNSSNNVTRPKSELAVDTQSSSVKKSSDSSLESTSPVEGQSVSSSLTIVKDPESEISAVFPVGAVVVVEARRWPGCNKRGGVACVTRVEQGKSVLYDVKYVLGGSEKGVEEAFISWHDDKVARPWSRSEVVASKRASMREKPQDSRKIASHESTQPSKDKSTSSLAKRQARQATHGDEDAIASGGENNSQPERTSSRLQTKRHSTLALLDDGTRGHGTPRSKSVRTRSSMEASSSILTEVAPYSNKRLKKRVRRADGTFLPSPASSRRIRDPLELLMP